VVVIKETVAVEVLVETLRETKLLLSKIKVTRPKSVGGTVPSTVAVKETLFPATEGLGYVDRVVVVELVAACVAEIKAKNSRKKRFAHRAMTVLAPVLCLVLAC